MASMLLTGVFIACSLMFILWVLHLLIKNASIVDVGWVFGIVLLVLLYASMGNGFWLRKFLIMVMTVSWGVRLGGYILFRIWGKEEEGRYQALRKEWGNHIAFKFLLFFLFQGVLDVVFALPAFFASINQNPEISHLEILSFGLCCFALLGESLADYQLTQFKKDPASKGKTCRAGLWNYSRHPNYFFEWLIWVSFFLFALASPFGFLSIACPILIFYFLFKVSGIPATEAQALRTKGDNYREYQRTTSVFIPWFPKRQGR